MLNFNDTLRNFVALYIPGYVLSVVFPSYMISKLLFLANFLILVASDGYYCGDNYLINAPSDLTKPYYFPENWNEGLQPATYNASQNCKWQINVLDGMYATVNFYKDSEGANSSVVSISVRYPNNDFAYLRDNDNAPFIFTSQQFEIHLRAGEQQGKFSFKVVWSYYPAKICKTNIQLDKSQLIPQASTNCAVTFTAPNRVWLVAFDKFLGGSTFLRHSAVFEGKNVNGKFLGTLDKAFDENIWSSGKYLTVYTFGMQLQDNRNIFLGMDVNVAGGTVDRFKGLDCTYSCSIYTLSMEPIGTEAVITASRNVDYLYYVNKIRENTTFSIYEGQLDSDHLLTTINATNYNQNLPLAVKNTVKIYKVDTMSTEIYMTHDAGKAQYGSIGYSSRKIVHSFDYRQFSLEQDTFENFTTGSQFMNFNFNVAYFDVNGPTTLEIIVYQNKGAVFSEKFNISNMPFSSVYTAVGNTISINYRTYGFKTRGFELDFVCSRSDVVSTPPPQITTTTVMPRITLSTTVVPKTTAAQTSLSTTVNPTTTVVQSTVSIPAITTAIVPTTTKGSSQNFILIFSMFLTIWLFV